jgi:hypothetical protein
VNDAAFVRSLERVGDLACDRQRVVDRDGGVPDAIGERLALDELHDESQRTARVLDAVDMGDMRMIERGEQLRLAFEARDAFAIGRHRRGKDLDRDVTLQPRVARAVHLTHASGTKCTEDLVGAQASTSR